MAGAMRLGALTHRMESRLLEGDGVVPPAPGVFDALDADLDHIAYVLDADGQFKNRCNLAMVDLEPVEEKDDVHILKNLIQRHLDYTESSVAKRILEKWEASLTKFVKVFPKEYRRALAELGQKKVAA
jgi:hypothetical protein